MDLNPWHNLLNYLYNIVSYELKSVSFNFKVVNEKFAVIEKVEYNDELLVIYCVFIINIYTSMCKLKFIFQPKSSSSFSKMDVFT